MELLVRVKTPVNAAGYDKIQSLVNSGADPQYLIDNYGVFLAAPPQNPSEPKKLNLPYEPFRDDQLEVVIRLPSTRVDKESVLERFERKELLSRLKQNLASINRLFIKNIQLNIKILKIYCTVWVLTLGC